MKNKIFKLKLSKDDLNPVEVIGFLWCVRLPNGKIKSIEELLEERDGKKFHSRGMMPNGRRKH